MSMTKSHGTGVFLPSYSPIHQRGCDRNGNNHRSSATTNNNGIGSHSGHPQLDHGTSPFAVALQNKLQELVLRQSYCSSSRHHVEGMLLPTSPFSSDSTSGNFLTTDTSYGAFSEPCAMGHNSSSISSSSSCCTAQDFAPVFPAAFPVTSPPLQYYNITPDQELQGMLLLQQQQEAEVDAVILRLLAARQQLAGMNTPAAMLPSAVSAASPSLMGLTQATGALGMQAEFIPMYGTQMAAAPAPAAAAAQVQLAQLQVQQQQLLGVEQQLQLQLQAEMARLMAIV